MQEEWDFDLDAAKHMQDVEADVVRHTASHPTWFRSAGLGHSVGKGRSAAWTPCWLEIHLAH
eukprot:4224931-Amphidinium_carterae.1